MNLKNKNVVITSALRTAIGSFNGSLKNMQGHELGTVVVKELIKKSDEDMKKICGKLKGTCNLSAQDCKDLKEILKNYTQK